MKTLRTEYPGMCLVVRDAIAQAWEPAQTRPLTIPGDLVHLETVLARTLRAEHPDLKLRPGGGDADGKLHLAGGSCIRKRRAMLMWAARR